MGLTVVLVALVIVASVLLYFRGRFAPAGSVARISVDDLATGRSPTICAVTGVPTVSRVEVSSTEGGFSPWWLLLVFLGPVGWVGLALLLALGRRPGRVSGVLHITPDALERYNAMVRVSTRATVGALATMVGGMVGLVVLQRTTDGVASWVVLAAVAVVVTGILIGLVAGIVAPFRWVDLELDGSGRWVTIHRAAPEFAAALHAQYDRDRIVAS